MAFKMKGWNSPLNNYKTGYFGEGKSAPLRKTYEEAYKTRDMSTYGDLSQEEYTAEAKRQKAIYERTGKWDWRNAPKKETVKDTGRTKKVKLDTATGSKTTKTVTDKADTVRKVKTVTKDKDDNVTKKTKEKFDKEGNRTKKKVTTKDKDTVTKMKVKDKKDEPAKVKTRKKGGTGLGSWAKRQLAKRAMKRAAKKLTE